MRGRSRAVITGALVWLALVTACGGPGALPPVNTEPPTDVTPPVTPPATPSETPEPGSPQWARALGAARGISVLAAPDGSLTLLAADDEPSSFDGRSVGGSLVLARYDTSGQLLDAKGMTAPGAWNGWLVPNSDGYYLMVEQTEAANLGCGPIDTTSAVSASIVARLSSDGSCRWAKRAGYLRSISPSMTDGLWLHGSSELLRYDGAGALQDFQHTVEMVGGRGNIDLHTVVRLNDGSLILGGTSNGNMRLAGRSWSGQVVPVLFRMMADGQVVWARPFPELFGFIQVVQITPGGTLLALASFGGAFSWAGAEVSPSEHTLLALDAAGTELWARPLDLQFSRNDPMRMVVDSAGAVVVMGQSLELCNGLGFTVTKFDATGTFLWQRPFTPERCEGEMRGHSLTSLSSREIVITGDYSGQITVGTQVLDRPEGRRFEAFLLKLAP